MSKILNSLDVIEYDENQVHVENNNKKIISSLPINTYLVRNIFGSMVEINVHECNLCNK